MLRIINNFPATWTMNTFAHQPEKDGDEEIRKQRRLWKLEIQDIFNRHAEDDENLIEEEMSNWINSHPAGKEALRNLYNHQLPLCFKHRVIQDTFTTLLKAMLEKFTALGADEDVSFILVGSSATGIKGNPNKGREMWPPPTWDRNSDADIALFFPRAVQEMSASGRMVLNKEYPNIMGKREFAASMPIVLHFFALVNIDLSGHLKDFSFVSDSFVERVHLPVEAAALRKLNITKEDIRMLREGKMTEELATKAEAAIDPMGVGGENFAMALVIIAAECEHKTGVHVSFKLNVDESLYPIMKQQGIVLLETGKYKDYRVDEDKCR